MNMRIDGQKPATDTEAARRSESAQTAERSSGPAAARPGASGDRVEVSSDAQLVAAAVKAAEESSSVRPEVVERGRRALEDGSLGKDAGKLADRIIDSLLGE